MGCLKSGSWIKRVGGEYVLFTEEFTKIREDKKSSRWYKNIFLVFLVRVQSKLVVL